jgi:biopolymer transport protein ExbD
VKRLRRLRGAETKKARVEIVPMIDAIFFLLVFFMYSSLSMVNMRGMGVSVPRLSDAPPAARKAPPRRYIVTVDRAGNTFLNLDRVPLDALSARLTAALAADPEGTIVVNVDAGRDVQTLVDVMDRVNAVRTPTGEPAGVIIATTPLDARKELADDAAAGGKR